MHLETITNYNNYVNNQVLAALPITFPLRYAIVAEKTEVASTRTTTSDYTSLLRKLGRLDEPVVMYSLGTIEGLLRKNESEIGSPNSDEWQISIISYEGTFEQPMFLYSVKQNYDKRITNAANQAQEIFEKLIAGYIDQATFHDIKAQFERIETVSLKKTKLMEWLEKNDESGGVFQSELFYQLRDDEPDPYTFSTNVFDVIEPESQVEIVVAGSWYSLFLEEISVIFDKLRLCQNCRKPLPSRYKGGYCPDMPENRKCLLERQSKRKKKERDQTAFHKRHKQNP